MDHLRDSRSISKQDIVKLFKGCDISSHAEQLWSCVRSVCISGKGVQLHEVYIFLFVFVFLKCINFPREGRGHMAFSIKAIMHNGSLTLWCTLRPKLSY